MVRAGPPRDTGGPIPFCGRRTSIPLGAVEIAARTGAAILPVSLVRDARDNYLTRVHPPIRVHPGDDPEFDLRRTAYRLLKLLEPELRAHPDQWHVMQPMFGDPMTEAEISSGDVGLPEAAPP